MIWLLPKNKVFIDRQLYPSHFNMNIFNERFLWSKSTINIESFDKRRQRFKPNLSVDDMDRYFKLQSNQSIRKLSSTIVEENDLMNNSKASK